MCHGWRPLVNATMLRLGLGSSSWSAGPGDQPGDIHGPLGAWSTRWPSRPPQVNSHVQGERAASPRAARVGAALHDARPGVGICDGTMAGRVVQLSLSQPAGILITSKPRTRNMLKVSWDCQWRNVSAYVC